MSGRPQHVFVEGGQEPDVCAQCDQHRDVHHITADEETSKVLSAALASRIRSSRRVHAFKRVGPQALLCAVCGRPEGNEMHRTKSTTPIGVIGLGVVASPSVARKLFWALNNLVVGVAKPEEVEQVKVLMEVLRDLVEKP